MNAPAVQLPRMRAAIVDLDGTMVDTVGDFELALGRTLDEMGLPRVDRAFIVRTVGRGSAHLLRRTLAEVGGAPERVDEAWGLYQRHYLEINGRASAVFDGVVAGLERLRAAGLKLACLTNKPGAFARPLLESKGLVGHFDQVFGGDDFERQKPDPLPILRTCESLGTAVHETLVIGDSRNDALAARAAGCPVVLVTYGYNHGEPVREVDADGWLDRLDDWVERGLAGR